MDTKKMNNKMISRKANLTYDIDTVLYMMKKKRAKAEEVLVEIKRA